MACEVRRHGPWRISPSASRTELAACSQTRAGILIGLLFSITVAAILFAIQAKAPHPRERAAPPAEPSPSQPAFLDKPAAEAAPDPSSHRPLEEIVRNYRDPYAQTAPPQGSEEAALPPPPPAATQSSAPPPPDPRRQAYLRALRAPLAAGPSSQPAAEAAPAPALPAAAPGLAEVAATLGAAAAPPTPREGRPAPFEGFLASVTRPASSELAVRWETARSAATLQAGTVIPAALVTAVNSDLPGDLVAQVTRNVYDSATLHTILVPAGSRLLGRYDHQIALGQSRLLVAWTRLLLPDGRSLAFPGLPGTSGNGEAGLSGSTDNHLRRVFGNALLLSLLSAGVQLSQPQESATFGQAASARQVAGAALGQELGSVALEILRRGIERQPTLRIPAGSEFYVLVHGDIAFPPPPGQ